MRYPDKNKPPGQSCPAASSFNPNSANGRPLRTCRGASLVLALLAGLFLTAGANAQFTTAPNGAKGLTITGYTGSGGVVDIPATISGTAVTAIGDNAFKNCATLAGVTMPPSVKTIGASAFVGTKLTGTVAIGSGVTAIGNSAFQDCASLTGVTMPASVKTIGTYAFAYTKLTGTVAIGSGVTVIGDYAFYYCASLTGVTIPASVKTIGAYAFFYSGLTSVMIGSGVTSIGEGAFYWCGSMTGVTIPASVKTIGDFAFQGSGLTSLTLGSGVTSIGDYAFYQCWNLTGVTIPASVKTIGNHAFQGSGLTSITIGSGVTAIGECAFQDCSKLISVTIPNSVTSIGYGAFYYCEALTSVTIPASVKTIGAGAFQGTGLTSVTIPNSVTSIGDYAFENCAALTSVAIPNSVKTIGAYAFQGSGLMSVTIGSGVTSIGNMAFFQCDSLQQAVFLGNAPAMGTGVFDIVGNNFVVDYNSGATGFGAPWPWERYTTQTTSGLFAVAVTNDYAPGIDNARYSSFGNPATNEQNHVAIQAVVAAIPGTLPAMTSANSSGIWAEVGGVNTLIARTGTPAPGIASGTFATLGDPAFNNNDAIAFYGTVKAAPAAGITAANAGGLWVTTSGSLGLVARAQTQAPGCPAGALFASFPQFVLPDQGGVVFLGKLATGTVLLPAAGGVVAANNQGIWAVDAAGALKLIVRTGDTQLINAVTRTISALAIFNATANSAGQSRHFNGPGDLTFKVTFTDKTQAIEQVVFP